MRNGPVTTPARLNASVQATRAASAVHKDIRRENRTSPLPPLHAQRFTR
jgi:hypothetical protein